MAPQDPVSLEGRLALGIADAARALGISERHLRAHLSEIPHVRIGGRLVFPVEVLKSWLSALAHQEQGRVDRMVNEMLESIRSDRPRRATRRAPK